MTDRLQKRMPALPCRRNRTLERSMPRNSARRVGDAELEKLWKCLQFVLNMCTLERSMPRNSAESHCVVSPNTRCLSRWFRVDEGRLFQGHAPKQRREQPRRASRGARCLHSLRARVAQPPFLPPLVPTVRPSVCTSLYSSLHVRARSP